MRRETQILKGFKPRVLVTPRGQAFRNLTQAAAFRLTGNAEEAMLLVLEAKHLRNRLTEGNYTWQGGIPCQHM